MFRTAIVLLCVAYGIDAASVFGGRRSYVGPVGHGVGSAPYLGGSLGPYGLGGHQANARAASTHAANVAKDVEARVAAHAKHREAAAEAKAAAKAAFERAQAANEAAHKAAAAAAAAANQAIQEEEVARQALARASTEHIGAEQVAAAPGGPGRAYATYRAPYVTAGSYTGPGYAAPNHGYYAQYGRGPRYSATFGYGGRYGGYYGGYKQ